MIASNISYGEVHPDTTIFKLGDTSDAFYILEKGCCEVNYPDRNKREIKSGEGFGELALLYEVPRSATVTALEYCGLWILDKVKFRLAVEQSIVYDMEEHISQLQRIIFLKNMLSQEQLDMSASLIKVLNYRKNEVIFEEGEPGSSAFIVKSGKIQCLSKSNQEVILTAGEVIGELSLLYNTIRTYTVKAVEKTSMLVIGRELLVTVLGEDCQVLCLKNYIKNLLSNDIRFASITSANMEKILNVTKIKHYTGGTELLQKNQEISWVYLLIEGVLMEMGTNKVVCEESQAWGHHLIDLPKSQRIVEDMLFLDRDSVLAEINIDIQSEFLQKDKQNNDQLSTKQIDFLNSHKTDNQRYGIQMHSKIRHFIKLNTIDVNHAYEIILVKHYKSGKLYQMKKIPRAIAKDLEIEKYIQSEKKGLEKISHTFIMPYLGDFKDENYVYFLYEFIPGMSLYEVIRKIGLLSTYDCQFYTVSILLIQDYLRGQNIIHRDIKPENFVIDSKGFLILSNFSILSILKTNEKTQTVIGTPHYMAPEIILCKKYDYNIDLWSLGICLYEFMCGSVPFGDESEDPYNIFEEIITKDIIFPEDLKDPKLIEFNQMLLNKDPDSRLVNEYTDLNSQKQIAAFSKFNWEGLKERHLIPTPYLPPKTISVDQEISKPRKNNEADFQEIKTFFSSESF